MVGKMLDEAHATQSAAHALQKSHNNCRGMTSATSQANMADRSTSVLINGKCYVLDSTTQMTTETNSALTTLTMEEYNQDE